MSATNALLSRLLATAVPLNAADMAMVAAIPCREVMLRRDVQLPRDGSVLPLLLEGWLCGYKTLSDGARQISSLQIAGEPPDFRKVFFPVDTDYRALVPCRVGVVATDLVRDLSEKSPAIALAIGRQMAKASAIYEEWIANVGRRRALTRVAHLLCEIMTRLNNLGRTGSDCDFPFTQSDLADATGLSTVHVNRVLQEMRNKALIELRNGRFALLDREGLARLAGFNPDYLHLRA